jgi:hypothetical protein|tara:strand:- start:809 stop:1240 length:432 start_codon:yes stop_codon:yes gene_type:complete
MISGQNIIKMLDIVYISIIQFTLAIFMNIGVDKLLTPEREKLDEHANVLQDFLLLCLMIAILVTLSYVIRHIVRLIPSPFHTMQGFRHDKLPELAEIAPITGFVLLTSGYIENRIHHLRQYFNLKTAFMNIDKNKKEATENNK